jgi:hypothetical protein
MTESIRKRFRQKVRTLLWRKGSMPAYYNCPHEFVIRSRGLYHPHASWGCREADFRFLARTIKEHGKRMKWRHRRDVMFFDDGYAYWRIGPVINRTDERGMMNDGHPPDEVLAQMRKRFWPSTADRRDYKREEEASRFICGR